MREIKKKTVRYINAYFLLLLVPINVTFSKPFYTLQEATYDL